MHFFFFQDAKFINVKEILEGKEELSDVPENQSKDPQIDIYKERIASLESNLSNSLSEKDASRYFPYSKSLILYLALSKQYFK